MNLPKPEWYKVEDLAEYWGCSVSVVNRFLESGQLKLSGRFTHEDFVDEWVACPKEDYIDDYITLSGNGYKFQGEYVRRQEVERFEKIHSQAVGDAQGGFTFENQKQEAGKVPIAELKKIAQKLHKLEKDSDVIAARLRDEYGAKYWQLVEIFNIQLSAVSKAKDPQGGKEKVAARSVKKGRKILQQRLEVK